MIKTLLNMLCGAVIFSIASAFAVVGQPPIPATGFGMVDGAWLNGLAGGQNDLFQSGITAHAGGTQAACVSLTPGIQLFEIDTVANSGDSICLPFAAAGTDIQISNAGAQPMSIYGQSANNPITAAADTINGTAGSSAYSVTNANNVQCFVAKNGAWKCVKGS